MRLVHVFLILVLALLLVYSLSFLRGYIYVSQYMLSTSWCSSPYCCLHPWNILITTTWSDLESILQEFAQVESNTVLLTDRTLYIYCSLQIIVVRTGRDPIQVAITVQSLLDQIPFDIDALYFTGLVHPWDPTLQEMTWVPRSWCQSNSSLCIEDLHSNLSVCEISIPTWLLTQTLYLLSLRNETYPRILTLSVSPWIESFKEDQAFLQTCRANQATQSLFNKRQCVLVKTLSDPSLKKVTSEHAKRIVSMLLNKRTRQEDVQRSHSL